MPEVPVEMSSTGPSLPPPIHKCTPPPAPTCWRKHKCSTHSLPKGDTTTTTPDLV